MANRSIPSQGPIVALPLSFHKRVTADYWRSASDRWDGLQFELDQAASDLERAVGEEATEAAGERYFAARAALLSHPAPDRAALAWKLGALLEVDTTGTTAIWADEDLAQVRRDIARYLGEA